MTTQPSNLSNPQISSHAEKADVDWLYTNPARPGGRLRVNTRVSFASGREVIFDGRLGKKEARKRAYEIVTRAQVTRLDSAVREAVTKIDPIANGPGAPRPIREAYQLLRTSLES